MNKNIKNTGLGKRLVITSVHKRAFFSGLFFFFLVHMFRLTNIMPNHDALTNYYSSQNIVSSGRWFLSVACMPSSFFDLIWIVGILCALYIALTCVLVVDILELKKSGTIIMVSGMIAVFPAICETMLFGFTADGYMLAMLFAAIGVRITTMPEKKWYKYIVAGIFLCLSCGIYQSYFSFAMILSIVYLITQILKDKFSTKALFVWSVKQVGLFVVSLVVYYVVWKLCVSFQQVETTDYQGIGQAEGFGIGNIFYAFKAVAISIYSLFFGESFSKGNISLHVVVNVAFAVAFVVIMIYATIKKKMLKQKGRLALLLISLVLIPFAVFFWQYVSKGVSYGARMLESVALLYILPFVVADEHLDIKWRRGIAILIGSLIFTFSLQTNITYMYLHKCYETTYYEVCAMATRINMISETGQEKIAVIGKTATDKEITNEPYYYEMETTYGTIKSSLAYDQLHISRFMRDVLKEDFEYASEAEVDMLANREEFTKMSDWPSKDSVKVIDGYVVIRLEDK